MKSFFHRFSKGQSIQGQKDSGRSMTEMLGVLAIIGVLSITALMGYNYAVTKHKTNATLKDLNQFVIIATQQLLAGRDTLDLSETKQPHLAGLSRYSLSARRPQVL